MIYRVEFTVLPETQGVVGEIEPLGWRFVAWGDDLPSLLKIAPDSNSGVWVKFQDPSETLIFLYQNGWVKRPSGLREVLVYREIRKTLRELKILERDFGEISAK